MVKRLITEKQLKKLKEKVQARKELKSAITKIKNVCGLTAKEVKALSIAFAEKEEGGTK
ncbi:hypothetical protein M0R36_04300 [bacterium]|nr:hypothetical protein [bacterium]